ncbi:unnamed protein product [Orchesella dallaii]|uniref:NB-ARC domain-containing protein n=1 Tax=Orchesella dallaii TaxID=48710 RepID=A0ABP1RJJ6_9HEXA
MELNEQHHITNHLHELIDCTDCNSILLAFLYAKKVVGRSDLASLNAIADRFEKSLAFYQLIIKRKDSYRFLLRALEETRQTGAISILNQIIEHPNDSSNQSPTRTEPLSLHDFSRDFETSDLHNQNNPEPVWFDVRPPVKLFTGRKLEILTLHEKLLQNQEIVTVVSQIASVTGLGGIGKTEVCRQYISQYCEYFDGNVIWINAESRESMTESFKRLAKSYLQISIKDMKGKEKDIEKIVYDVYTFFQNRKSLFVFDNAESGEYLECFLPLRVRKKPHILVTSRDKDWDLDVHVLVLKELTEEEALEFTIKGLNIPKTDIELIEECRQLVLKLQCFPLAIQQAISFIKQKQRVISFSPTLYLDLFDEHSETLLDSEIAGSFNSYKRTTFNTWQLTRNLILSVKDKGALAIKILNLISYFGADNIPVNFLIGLTNCDQFQVLASLELLVKYSMINTDPQQCTLSVHRLVQEVNRIRLKQSKDEQKILALTLQHLQLGINSNAVDHASSVWGFSSKYPTLVQEFAGLPSIITKGYHESQKFEEAQNFASNCCDYMVSILSDKNADVLSLKFALATALFQRGALNEALKLGIDILENAKQTFGELNSQVFDIENLVCEILKLQEKNKECRDRCKELLRKMELVCPRNDKSIINTLKIFGSSLGELGNYEESIAVFEDAVSRAKTADPTNNSMMVYRIMQNISVGYRGMGNMKLGEKTLRETYTQANVHHAKHPSTLLMGQNLAIFLYEQGNYNESYRICQDIYERRKQLLGLDHFDTIYTSCYLGKLLMLQEKYDEALVIHQNAYGKVVDQLGDHNFLTLFIKRGMCLIWSKIGMKDEALLTLHEICASLLVPYGEASSHVCNTRIEIAEVLESLGRDQEALQVLMQVKNTLISRYGDKHHSLVKIEKSIDRLSSMQLQHEFKRPETKFHIYFVAAVVISLLAYLLRYLYG